MNKITLQYRGRRISTKNTIIYCYHASDTDKEELYKKQVIPLGIGQSFTCVRTDQGIQSPYKHLKTEEIDATIWREKDKHAWEELQLFRISKKDMPSQYENAIDILINIYYSLPHQQRQSFIVKIITDLK